MTIVRNKQFVARRVNNMCMSCQCKNGQFACSRPRDNSSDCSRSDPDDNNRPANCMMDGEMVMHNQQRMVSDTRV